MRDDTTRALERELVRANLILAAAVKLLGKPPALEDRSSEYAKAWAEGPEVVVAWRIQDLRARIRLTKDALHPESRE